jgi:PAS domain S-box-containing protein
MVVLEARGMKKTPPPPVKNPRLVHQLELHNAELQRQNEALIASRDQAEAALERFRAVFEFAPLGYATLEDSDMITEINLRGAELVGQHRDELIGQRFTALIAPASQTVFANMITGAMTKGGGGVKGDVDLWRRGAALPVRLHATMLRRNKTVVLLAFEDISERRAKEVELLRVEHALRDAMRRKDEFLSALSHELRNPLAPIRMSVSVLEMIGLTNDKAREAVEIIDRSSAHLKRLIDDLLDVTRIARNKINLKRETVELSALVQRVVDEHAAQFAASGIRVDVKLSLAPLWVNGDPARLVQIVSNLLGNAEKFTPSGGHVSVITEVTNGAVLLRVRDTGVGIPPDVITELGVPFVQAMQSIDRSRGGLGLGLAMVRSLAELHGGSIAIRSEGVGCGTEVLVSLPEYTAPVVPAPEPILAPLAPPRRVLLIEDNADAAQSLAKALGLRGHDVAIAHDGRHGIARAGELIPDVVLCDLGLPDCDGHLVARRLREDSRLRDVALVALSGYAQPDDIARSTAAGFDCHLAKPASLVDIDAILRDLPRR